MNARGFQRLSREYLLPRLPGFRAKGGLLFAEPLEELLRGFYFEPSGFDRCMFYASVFVQPLYVPSTHIVLHYGARLGPGWNLAEGSEHQVMSSLLSWINREGLPFLQKTETPRDFVAWLMQSKFNPRDAYPVEALAYSLILMGEYDRAFQAFDDLDRIIAQSAPGLQWLSEIAQRSRPIRKALAKDPHHAVALLNDWKQNTVRNLRLGDRVAVNP